MASFGERLKMLREESNLKQEDLAGILNLHRGTISKYECGEREPDIQISCQIADHFKVTLDWLFGRSPLPRKYNPDTSFKTNFLSDGREEYTVNCGDSLFDIYSELTNPERHELRLFAEFLKLRRNYEKR